MKKIAKIDMFKEYVGKLIFRCIIFLIVLGVYVFRPEELEKPWMYVVWAVFMLSMISQLFPANRRITMGSKKGFAEHFSPANNYDRLKMYEYVQVNNLAAVRVLLVWLSLNAIFGILYVADIIGPHELLLLSTFYYVCDLICVVIWCPFQSFIIKNKCCVNCRIFNWGYFMMFTPMLFIRNFFTWSLFFTSLVLLIRWEITIIKHPERFWEGSNAILRCTNCQDKICRLKGPKFLDRIEK